MNTALHTTTSYHTTLRTVRGLQQMNERIRGMAAAAWAIAYTALWNGQVLSEDEQQQALTWIRYFLLDANDADKAYVEFVERVLMARQYVTRVAGRYIPTPSEWMDHQNPKGFAGTAEWYARLQHQRKAMPLHNLYMKALAEAVQEMQEEPCARHFHYWRAYFIERNWQSTLNLFLGAVSNMRYNLTI